MKFIYIIFVLVLALYALVNYYIGKKALENLFLFEQIKYKITFWIILWFVAFSYPAGKLLANYWDGYAVTSLIVLGAHWMGAVFYLVLVLFLIDCIMFIGRLVSFNFTITKRVTHMISIAITVCISLLLLYGSWNAWNPHVITYDITIPKNSNVESLHVVLISDIHLGGIIGERFLEKGVELINELEPDIILITGDVIDDDIAPLREDTMIRLFEKLDAKIGIYAVIGNHEYISGTVDEAIDILQDSGIQVLRDAYALINDSIYIVGRDDMFRNSLDIDRRMEIASIIEDIDRNLPIIVMDHQPLEFKELYEAGVDLLVAGHTHHGQLYPINYITKMMYGIDSGYMYKESLQIIVTSGFGTWGPPYRVGSRSQIVQVLMNFNQPDN